MWDTLKNKITLITVLIQKMTSWESQLENLKSISISTHESQSWSTFAFSRSRFFTGGDQLQRNLIIAQFQSKSADRMKNFFCSSKLPILSSVFLRKLCDKHTIVLQQGAPLSKFHTGTSSFLTARSKPWVFFCIIAIHRVIACIT